MCFYASLWRCFLNLALRIYTSACTWQQWKWQTWDSGRLRRTGKQPLLATTALDRCSWSFRQWTTELMLLNYFLHILRKKRRKSQVVASVRLKITMRDWSLWTYHEPSSWTEAMVPVRPDWYFKSNFGVSPSTFAYLLAECTQYQDADRSFISKSLRNLFVPVGITCYGENFGTHFRCEQVVYTFAYRELCDLLVQNSTRHMLTA